MPPKPIGTPSGLDVDAPTVAATRALFARLSRNARVIVPLNASASDPRARNPALYCVHSITGAGGTDYLPLARQLDASVRMLGVQAPPRRMEEPAFVAGLAELADVYADAIAAAQPCGPLLLAGWSAGATIALEVAHRLRMRGREIALLVAIDGAPEIPGGVRPWDPRFWLKVARNLPAWFADCREMDKGFPVTNVVRRVTFCARNAGRLVRRHKPEVAPRLERFINGIDRFPAAQRQFMSRLYDAIMGYRPQAWDGPVVIYQARVSPVLAPPQYLERWRRVAPRAELRILDGNHQTMMIEPKVADLARDLEKRIACAVAAHPPPVEAR